MTLERWLFGLSSRLVKAAVTNDVYDEFVMFPYYIQDINENYIIINYVTGLSLRSFCSLFSLMKVFPPLGHNS